MGQAQQYCPSIQPGGHIVEDDAPAFGEFFQLADGKGLVDVEEAKEQQRQENVLPVVRGPGEGEQGDPLAGDFVDDDEAGVFAAAFTGGDGGCGDSEADGKCNSGEGERQEQNRRRVKQKRNATPDEDGGNGAPCSGAWLAEAGSEEGGDGPCPEGFLTSHELAGRPFGPTAFDRLGARSCFGGGFTGHVRCLPDLRVRRGRVRES